MENFVLKGNIIYSISKDKLAVHPDSYLVCENGLCNGIYDYIPDVYKDFQIIDYSDRLIIPGLIDTHIHAPQFAFRGMGMDLELLDWLNSQAFPEEAKYSDSAYAKKAYTIFTEALKKSATTRAVVFATRHVQATKILMNLLESSGLITYVGKINMDQNAPEDLKEENATVSAEDTIQWLKDTTGKYKNTKPILTPRFIPSCSKPLLEELQRIRNRYDLPVQSHLSENLSEIEWVKQLFPDSEFYGQCYDNYDLFGTRSESKLHEPTVMAHCVYSESCEMELIKNNQVVVAHCPSSNMNLSSGIAPIRKYLDNNVKVALGSDVAGGHTESIFRAITDAIQVSKMYWRLIDNNDKPITFEEAFYMATVTGGEVFGKVGKFAPGYEFDALVLNDDNISHPQKLTLVQRLERFAYLSGDINGIESKFVAGKKIF